jgi:hypothetical protein
MTTEPTDADRQRAREIRQTIHQTLGWPLQDEVIAQALADERHRALAPLHDLADELEVTASRYVHAAPGSHDAGARNAHIAIADRIRRDAGQQP